MRERQAMRRGRWPLCPYHVTIKTTMQSISRQLESYPDFLAPLRDAAKRYLKYPSAISKDGVLSIGHRPWVAELNYMFTLYPGISREALDRYCGRFRIQVPAMYVQVLAAVNGAFCFGMPPCGVPPSMLADPPLLDRKNLQCHDLATAATRWVRNY